MKKSVLLHSELSHVIADMGHTQELTIGDSGLPVPPGVEKIDLAVSRGVPDFLSVLWAVFTELQVERVLLAKELEKSNSDLYHKLCGLISAMEKEEHRSIPITYLSHQELKERTQNSRAVVRTGEATPFANIILVSGVTF